MEVNTKKVIFFRKILPFINLFYNPLIYCLVLFNVIMIALRTFFTIFVTIILIIIVTIILIIFVIIEFSASTDQSWLRAASP